MITTTPCDIFPRMGVPRYLMVLLTLRCHHSCPFCSVSAPQKLDLDYDILETVLASLKTNGGNQVGFSGGEPFLYPRFYDAIMDAKQLGLKVSVTTTGNFIDKDNIGTLACFVDEFGISLHGGEETHNAQTNSRDGYAKVIRALDVIRRQAFNTSVTLLHTVTQQNCDPRHLNHAIDVAEEYGASVFVARAIRAGECSEDQMLTLSGLQELVRRVYSLGKAGKPVKMIECIPHCILDGPERESARGCGAGIGFGCLDTAGAVKICPQSKLTLGSISPTVGLLDIWNGVEAERFRDGEWLSTTCKSCDRVTSCRSGCHIEQGYGGYASDYYFNARIGSTTISLPVLRSK